MEVTITLFGVHVTFTVGRVEYEPDDTADGGPQLTLIDGGQDDCLLGFKTPSLDYDGDDDDD